MSGRPVDKNRNNRRDRGGHTITQDPTLHPSDQQIIRQICKNEKTPDQIYASTGYDQRTIQKRLDRISEIAPLVNLRNHAYHINQLGASTCLIVPTTYKGEKKYGMGFAGTTRQGCSRCLESRQ